MKDQPVLRCLVKLTIPFVMIFGFYVITHGELGPGGGFQGGVILAAAAILFGLIYGQREVARVFPDRVMHTCMGLGVLFYAGVGVYSILDGRRYLDYSSLGSVAADAEAWGMTLVEYGVGLTVASVMVTLFNKMVEEE